jgi:hypothetical protein
VRRPVRHALDGGRARTEVLLATPACGGVAHQYLSHGDVAGTMLTELSLEPDEYPAARPFKQALVEDGIPFTSFAADDVAAEYERLVGRGMRFTQSPTEMRLVTTAVFDDTCGDLIQIAAENS